MSNIQSTFLKEMGISEWVSRDGAKTDTEERVQAPASIPQGNWWFFGTKPQGDAEVLFQNMVRVLGLSPQEWSWKNATENVSAPRTPDNGLPVVAFAFGGPVTQKITGERDPLPQLRETVLALNNGSDEEIPVIASFDLMQVLTKPKDKALLWQDLLLAKSVLQNI